jgi:plastocyanin
MTCSRHRLAFAVVAMIALPAGAPAVATAAADVSKGTITGTVEAKPSKFLPETVVYLVNVPGKWPAQTLEIDQKGMTFDPHILIITVGDSVQFHNHDKVDHNVFSPDGGYDLGTWGFNKSIVHAFDKAGVYSHLCKVHPEMLAYVFVGQNPYAAVVDDKGNFTIDGVPPGTYELAVWNSHLKAVAQKITVKAGKQTAHFALKR